MLLVPYAVYSARARKYEWWSSEWPSLIHAASRSWFRVVDIGYCDCFNLSAMSVMQPCFHVEKKSHVPSLIASVDYQGIVCCSEVHWFNTRWHQLHGESRRLLQPNSTVSGGSRYSDNRYSHSLQCLQSWISAAFENLFITGKNQWPTLNLFTNLHGLFLPRKRQLFFLTYHNQPAGLYYTVQNGYELSQYRNVAHSCDDIINNNITCVKPSIWRIWSVVSSTSKNDISDIQWMQASLPVKYTGLWVRQVYSLASPAFLASVASTAEMLNSVLFHCLPAPAVPIP
jgi:hypothetical protein